MEVGGTSQVNVTMVPSLCGNKLKLEMDGSGEIGREEAESDVNREALCCTGTRKRRFAHTV